MRYLLIPIILCILFSASYSQNNFQLGEVRLEQLDAQIRLALDLLNQFPDKHAENMLKTVQQSRNDIQMLVNQKRYGLAGMQFMAALSLVEKVINQLSQNPLKRMQEEVNELLRNVDQAITGERNSRLAERLLKDAKNNIKNGNKSYQQGRTLMAVENYRVAKFLLERCLGLIGGGKLDILETLRNEKVKYEELLQRAEEVVSVCENPQAGKLLVEAKKQDQTIRRAVAQGNEALALNLYYSTTRLLLRAIDMCQGFALPAKEQALEDMEMLQSLYETALEEEQGNRNIAILTKVRNLQNQAQSAINHGNYQLAVRRINLARNLLSRLWGGDSQELKQEQAAQELEQLMADIQAQEEKLNFGSSTKDKQMLIAAQTSANDARKFLSRNWLNAALQSILASNRFLSAMESSQSEIKAGSKQNLELEIERLAERIRSLENEGMERERMRAARQMLNKAEQALNDNNLEIASEYVRLGFSLLSNLE